MEGGGQGGEGRLQQPLCSRGGEAGSAPRTAPAFVWVRTPGAEHSRAATASALADFPENLLREEKEREENQRWELEFSRPLPLRPNSAPIPSPGITAADSNSVSRGTSLLPTRCWGPGSPGGELRLRLELVSPSPP